MTCTYDGEIVTKKQLYPVLSCSMYAIVPLNHLIPGYGHLKRHKVHKVSMYGAHSAASDALKRRVRYTAGALATIFMT